MGEFCNAVDDIHGILRTLMEPTPLQKNQYLCDLFQAEIWLKREDLTPVRSYKIRGAFAFLTAALEENPSQERFVCSSAGNHAQGFAFACRHFKKQGTIFMPLTTPQQKVMKTKAFGAPFVDIKLIGDGFDAANRAALDHCEREGGMLVPPFDHPTTIRGQATVGREIMDQLPDMGALDRVILPVGGGGLSAGVTRYLSEQGVDCAFTFVEPDGAPSLRESLIHGDRVQLHEVDNFVDGAAVARIGEHTFDALKGFDADQVVLAPTNGVCATMIDMLNVEGIVLEPAGALAIDALKRLPAAEVRGNTIICVTSGGNFDFERLPEVKERALKFSGLKKYFVIQLPQRPGALKDFLGILGPDDDISRFEYLKKSARNFGTVLLGIETKDAGNFSGLLERFQETGIRWQDITDDDLVANLLI